MVTQNIQLSMNREEGPDIIIRQSDSGLRVIRFELGTYDGDTFIQYIMPEGYVARFNMLKPGSNNFIIADLESAEDGLYLTITPQMSAVTGVGHYDVTVEDNHNHYVWSATGCVIVDDNVISNKTVADVSEVNGLNFPDDFLTTADDVAKINDSVTGSTSVWSSYKTNDEIQSAIESIDVPPAVTYDNVEHEVGTWMDKTLYSITYHDHYESPGSGAHSINHDLPGRVVLTEINYIEYVYGGGTYLLIADQADSYLNISIPDAPSPTYFTATQTVGNVSITDVFYTLYYVKEV